MYQGASEIEKKNWDYQRYEPSKIDFIIITHTHIDHCGLLPLMVRHGFTGKIYATPPTVDSLEIMLADSAHIQEVEALWKSRKNLRRGGKAIATLYNETDAKQVMPFLVKIPYETPFEPHAGIKMVFRDAGHILGSAFVEMFVDENGKKQRLFFRRHWKAAAVHYQRPRRYCFGRLPYHGINLW